MTPAEYRRHNAAVERRAAEYFKEMDRLAADQAAAPLKPKAPQEPMRPRPRRRPAKLNPTQAEYLA